MIGIDMEKPDSYEALLEAITPELHQQLRRAIELGRWPSGERLSEEQREHCLQAVIAWESRHLPEEERIGYIDRGKPDADAAHPKGDA